MPTEDRAPGGRPPRVAPVVSRETLVDRVRARLTRTRVYLREALAGHEHETLEWWPRALYTLTPSGEVVPTTRDAPPDPSSRAWPLNVAPADMTVAHALARLDAEADALAETTGTDIYHLAHTLVPAKLRRAVLAREALITRWPWRWPPMLDANGTPTPDVDPTRFHVAQLLEMLRARVPLQPDELPLGTWPLEVAPADVLAWANPKAGTVRTPTFGPPPRSAWIAASADDFQNFHAWGWRERADSYWWVAVAVLYATQQAVERDRHRQAVAIDAGRPHHELLMGWRDLPDKPTTYSVINDRIELLAPGGGCVQLTLDLDGDGSTNEALIMALRAMRGPEGLRHWAAVQTLLSVDGGRQGWVRWTLDAHLAAMGVPVKNRSKAAVREQAARLVELFTKIEIAVYAKDGTLRTRRPLLLVGAKYDRLHGSAWHLDGMQLTINPLLYTGVREENGKLGRNWHPAPVELAAINERVYPHAHATGLTLPIRWNLALDEGKDHVTLTGESALKVAGIPYKPHDRRWLAHRAWKALERTFAELQRIGQLGRWEWDAADTPRTLRGRLHLWQSEWTADRTLHGVRPQERPAGPAVLTGAELKTWRKRKGLTQVQAAALLRVSRRTIAGAEARPIEPLSTALAGKLRTAGA